LIGKSTNKALKGLVDKKLPALSLTVLKQISKMNNEKLLMTSKNF